MLVAYAQHAGGVDVAVIEAGAFDGFERTQQAFGDLAGFLGSERALAQHLGKRLVERLHHGVN